MIFTHLINFITIYPKTPSPTPPASTAHIAGSPPLLSVAAARRIGAKHGGHYSAAPPRGGKGIGIE
jgi:hypothetical protein